VLRHNYDRVAEELLRLGLERAQANQPHFIQTGAEV
jgi:hypothetical protein